MGQDKFVTGEERFFDKDMIIVSKTNVQGHITYANRMFLDIAGYTEDEILGQPHSIIRHPDMPRCIFKLLWDTLGEGREVFAYVVNRCKDGAHYWVYAHVTPSFGNNGEIIGYHSSRRVPDRDIVEKAIIPLYKDLKAEEEIPQNRKTGLAQSTQMMDAMLSDKGIGYDEFVLTL